MLTTALIAFREFFEAFLITGVFLGVSRKLSLKREFEILIAAGAGILLSLVLAVGAYIFSDRLHSILTERNADVLESYLLIFSGVFIAYVVFSLHKTLSAGHRKMVAEASKKFEERAFDISLFFTIMFLVLREGFEVALFSSSVSVFATFAQNFLGLVIGLASASALGVSTFFAYAKLPVGKVFKITEYVIVWIGAVLTELGITKLLETHFTIHLSEILPLHLSFLPSEDTFLGHTVQGLLGIDQEFSVARATLLGAYIVLVYVFLMRKKQVSAVQK